MGNRRRLFAALAPHPIRRRRLAGARFSVTIVLILGMLLPGVTGGAAAQDAVDGNVYTSPTYDYELEWDEDDWEVEDEDAGDRDFLMLLETDGTSLVYIEGYEAYDGDPDDCLEGSAEEILDADSVSDVEPLEDEAGDEIAGEDDGIAFAAYAFVTETDDGEQDRASYFTCQTLVEDEAVLAFSFLGVLEEFEDDLPVWIDLIDGLTLPNADADRDRDDEDDQESEDQGEEDRAEDEDDSDSSGGENATATLAGGPARTGVQPGPAPADEPVELWTFETGDDFVGASAATVSLDDGLVFTSSNAVYAFDIETGEEVWSFESEARMGFVAPLALADGVLYAAGEDGSVYAFEPDSGDIIWQTDLTAGLPVNGGPLVTGNMLYVTAWDEHVYAVEASTGDMLGSIAIGGLSFGQPSLAGGYVLLSAPTNGVMALEASSGEEAWIFETDGVVYPSPVVVDDVVYIGSDDGTLHAVELESGDELWSVDTGAPINTALAVSDDVVYAANDDVVLGAYDAESGDELWTIDVDGSDLGGVTVTETEAGDTLILIGDGDGVLHAFDEDGDEVYTAEVTDAAIYWPATVIDGTIYVSARDGSVYAFTEE